MSKHENKTSLAVQEYYGKLLQKSDDLKTGACCNPSKMPPHLREILRLIHTEVTEKFYGCGSPIPKLLDGMTVLDLGCGSGRDVYTLSKLVGENGKVIGIDMTDEQLDVAKRHEDYHAKQFGFKKSNVSFHKGYIEDLAAIGIEDGSIDIVVSNCVINLSYDKPALFKEIFRVLKIGGELLFSDVFSDRRVPQHIKEDEVILGECLGGALYYEDFRRMLASIGCQDVRTLASTPVPILDPAIEEKTGMINFSSITVRAFKLTDLEDRCEDFGQTATYLGTMPRAPHSFMLDDHHLFYTGKPMLVCGNSASMIANSRYGKHFKITGDKSVHHGTFSCDTATNDNSNEGESCC